MTNLCYTGRIFGLKCDVKPRRIFLTNAQNSILLSRVQTLTIPYMIGCYVSSRPAAATQQLVRRSCVEHPHLQQLVEALTSHVYHVVQEVGVEADHFVGGEEVLGVGSKREMNRNRLFYGQHAPPILFTPPTPVSSPVDGLLIRSSLIINERE